MTVFYSALECTIGKDPLGGLQELSKKLDFETFVLRRRLFRNFLQDFGKLSYAEKGFATFFGESWNLPNFFKKPLLVHPKKRGFNRSNFAKH